MEPTCDSYLSAAIKLLHSSAPDSAQKMRKILESEIEKQFDKNRTYLTKKQLNNVIEQETKAVGSGFKLKKHKMKKIEEMKIQLPVIENQIIVNSSSDSENESALDLLSDLTCVRCQQMDNTASNQLFECKECHNLLHQLCDQMTNSSEVDLGSWVCSSCRAKKDKEKVSKSYESSSSSSSSKNEEKVKEKSEEKMEKKFDMLKVQKKSSSSSSSRSRSSKK